MTLNEKEKNDALAKVETLSINAEKAGNEQQAEVRGKEGTVNQEKDDSESLQKATEQSIDPWSVEAATDEQGNTLEFDYLQISKYVHRKQRSSFHL